MAPFAVVGFVAVALFAAMLLLSYVQYTVLNGQMASLNSEVSALQAENAALSAQYEKVFDMETIQQSVGESMSRPGTDQVVYVDLSQEDSVEVFREESSLMEALRAVGQTLGEMIEYFR